MRITKLVHSCLLIEGRLSSDEQRNILIDPGKFSWESGIVDLNKIPPINRILITHEHTDHFHLPFVKAVLEKYPGAKIVSNESVVKLLQAEGLSAQVNSTNCSQRFNANHEALGKYKAPQNTGFHVLDQLTHPGDSHHFSATKNILALPVSAPWGSLISALNLATKLNPKKVIPIHDWHWSKAGRQWSYDFASDYLSSTGVEFIKISSGEMIEL